MKSKNKKFLLALGTPISLSVLTLISCQATSSGLSANSANNIITPGWKKQTFLLNINSQSSERTKDYYMDNSTSAAGITLDSMYLTTPTLFSLQYEGDLEIDVEQNSWEKRGQENYVTKTPGYYYRSMILAEKVIVTKTNGKTIEFDNDDHEEGKIKEGEKTSKTLIQLTSKNPKSINSANFVEALSNAQKIQITIKKNIPWMKYNGEKSDYLVKPLDFYYGWMRANLFSTDYRRANGGSELLDNEARRISSLTDAETEMFGTAAHLSNDYLFQVFGINKKSFLKEDEFLTKVGNTEELALTFNSNSENASFNGLFDKILVGSTYFSPVSSDFIDNKTKNPEFKNLGETGQAKRFGIYWYGKNYKNDILYASPYLPYDITSSREEYIRNEEYARKGWKEIKDRAILKVVSKYGLYPDPATFNQSQFRNYEEGTINQLLFKNLNETDKNIVAKDFKKYGMKLRRGENKGSLIYTLSEIHLPGPSDYRNPSKNTDTDQEVEKKYYYNDNYAELVFGVKTSELQKGTAKVVSNLFQGRGLSFRTILGAAFNQYTFTKKAVSPFRDPWYSTAAPDNKIGGSDSANNPKSTPRDYIDTLNSLFAIDSNGNIFYKKNVQEEKEQNAKNLQSNLDQYKAPNFEILQNQMTALLDDFYREKNLNETTDKVAFELPSRHTNENANMIDGLKKVAEMYNTLDKKGRLQVTANVPMGPNDFYNILRDGYGRNGFSGWGYDYDGIGTGLDGMIYARGSALLGLTSLYASLDKTNQLSKTFSNFKDYSDSMKEFFDKKYKEYTDQDLAYTFTPFDQWKDLTNGHDTLVKPIWYVYEYEVDENTQLPKIGANKKPIPKKNDKGEIVYKYDEQGNPIWEEEKEWSIENGKLVKKPITKRRAVNNSYTYASQVTFTKNIDGKELTFKDESHSKIIDGVEKVFSHKRGKWVNVSDDDFTALTALFNSVYQEETTNEKLINVFKELRILYGTSPDKNSNISSGQPEIVLINPNLIIPLSTENFIPIGDILIRKEGGNN